jgi:signal transduction histidine kinase
MSTSALAGNEDGSGPVALPPDLALAEAEARVARLEAELDQLVHIASHDLREPLRGIDRLAVWIGEDLGEAMPPAVAEHLSLLRGRGRRLGRLLDDLLAYCRVGRAGGRVERVDLAALAARAVALLEVPEGMIVEIEPRLPTLRAEPAALETVLRNLLANAIRHHDRRRGCVRVGARIRPDALELRVTDDGPGIPPAYHERIFAPFRTLKPKRDGHGTGMGLAIVRRLVEGHGGIVIVESAPPARGATFRAIFPLPWRRPGRARSG